MAGTVRTALMAGGALLALAAIPLAAAQDAALPSGDVDLSDPSAPMATPADTRLSLNVDPNAAVRFSQPERSAGRERNVELEIAADGGPVDVSIAQRATLSSDQGDVARQGRGSELRVGRGLVERRDQPEGNASSTYVFVASDNEALAWRPGERNEFGSRSSSLSLQDQVTVGDVSAGVTYEQSGVQASLAYVEREQSTTVGTQSFSQKESFAGVTLTMRR